jgi:hypothetical protein
MSAPGRARRPRPGGRPGPGQPHDEPDDGRDQPLRGHVQVAVGLGDHAGGEAGEQPADHGRAPVQPQLPGEQQVPAGRGRGQVQRDQDRERHARAEQCRHRGHQHAVQDVRGVAHQVHAVGGVEPVGDQREVALPDEHPVGQEPLDQRLVVDVVRDGAGVRVRPQPAEEPQRDADVHQADRGVEGARRGRPAPEAGQKARFGGIRRFGLVERLWGRRLVRRFRHSATVGLTGHPLAGCAAHGRYGIARVARA